MKKVLGDVRTDVPASRSSVSHETTVYDALPTLASMHTVDRKNYADIIEDDFWDVFEQYKPYTCLNVERYYNIYKTVEYIASSGIAGDFAECGVFLGGSIIGAAIFAKKFGLTDRRFFAFDTFEGFPAETIETDFDGTTMDLSHLPVFNNNFREVVEKNIANSGLAPESIVLIQGTVESTLPNWQGSSLCYLRLDTDYYTSTMIELDSLYPRLELGGALIVDDYGHFTGVRKATDDYFRTHLRKPLLQRVDYTGRCGIKI